MDDNRNHRDPEVLEEEFIPQNIPCREVQKKELAFCLSPIEKGMKPLDCLCHGKPERERQLSPEKFRARSLRRTRENTLLRNIEAKHMLRSKHPLCDELDEKKKIHSGGNLE